MKNIKGARIMKDLKGIYTALLTPFDEKGSINEEELNRELYTNVLQHLQDMMDESDRMKELNNKK
jgi:hypothetical protein